MAQPTTPADTLAAELRHSQALAAILIAAGWADAQSRMAALETAVAGKDWKDSARVASAASIANLSSVAVANFDGTGQGVTLVAGNRVLLKDTASADGIEGLSGKRNWIYVVGTVVAGNAPLTRATDVNTSAQVSSDSAVMVSEGTSAGLGYFISTADPITLDTTVLTIAPMLATSAPANITRAAAAIGTSTAGAHADHKHDVATAAAVGLTSASTNAAGSSSSLAQADHSHALTAIDGRSAGQLTEVATGAIPVTGIVPVLHFILIVPAGASGNVDFTGLPLKIRVVSVVASKTTTSADAGDTGQLQTGAGVAISNSLALNVTANTRVTATNIDPAAGTIASAGTIRWARVQSTDASCKVHVTCVAVP